MNIIFTITIFSFCYSIINELKQKGWDQQNAKASHEEEDEVYVSRVRKSHRDSENPETLDNFKKCGRCTGLYRKSTYKKHLIRCMDGVTNDGKHSAAINNRAMNLVHHKATPYFKTMVAVMDNDVPGFIVRNDELLVRFGNDEAFRYRAVTQSYGGVRQNLRSMARLLVHLRARSSQISQMRDIFRPEHLDICYESINALGNFNADTDLYATPSTALQTGRVVVNVCDAWINLCIRRKLIEDQKEAEDWKKIFEIEFPKFIGKTVAETFTHNRIAKGPVKLPIMKDIFQVSKHVTEVRQKSHKFLKSQKFDAVHMKRLMKSTLVSIQLLNRKRPMELQRMRISAFKNSIEQLNEKSHPDFYPRLSNGKFSII